MKVNIDGNIFLKTNNLPDNILSITTTKECKVYDIFYSQENQKSIYLESTFFKKYFNINYFLLPNQIHSNRVLYIDRCNSSFFEIECDGFITDKKNVALGILTADCYAVQFFGNHLIANIHCGWRGIYGGIIENTIKYFKDYNDEIIKALIGVGICEKCYVVNYDLIEKFRKKYKNVPYYKDFASQYHLSLRDLIINILEEEKIYNIEELKYCSFCNDFLYSYRRDNKTIKRLLSLIVQY
jgi:hypothetical protein